MCPLRYVRQGESIGFPDLIILPGSKNTIEDLLYLRQQGYEEEIVNLVAAGTPIVGICGGYQMLGQEIHDPEHTESSLGQVIGLGLLDTITVFEAEKMTHQVSVRASFQEFLGLYYSEDHLCGYEIHMGRTQLLVPVQPAFVITGRSGQTTESMDGAVRSDGSGDGYLHSWYL